MSHSLQTSPLLQTQKSQRQRHSASMVASRDRSRRGDAVPHHTFTRHLPPKPLLLAHLPRDRAKGVLCSALIDGLGQSTDKSTPVLAHAITPEQGQEESKSKGQCLFLQQGRDLKHQYQVSIHMMVSSSRMMTGRGNPDVAPGWC